ncbi:MAG: zf-HC2 domain-containing protein [Armatimonadetes bacterium]|nr:zf-HC2 domain-containing protein [Armatimonadota bacterium]MDW8028051.1 zf-HC2 domain-containing protein [Armatimonadota bacterium]
MNCQQFHRHLLAWIEGELDEATWLSVAQHLENCERCQAEAQRLKQAILALKAIANSDEVPTIPQRLWQKLTPRRKRLPSFAAIFATAFIAFLVGWHARSIASSSQLLQVVTSEARNVNREIERRQNNLAQKQIALVGNLTLALGKPNNLVGSNRRNRASLLNRLSSVPTSFSRFSPLTLNGATALAFEKFQPDRLCVNSLERCLAFGGDSSIADELQEFGSDIQLDDESVWFFVTVENQQPSEPQPYRIFVQVSDSQTQTVRTIKVDTTDPKNIVAEWSEVNCSK